MFSIVSINIIFFIHIFLNQTNIYHNTFVKSETTLRYIILISMFNDISNSIILNYHNIKKKLLESLGMTIIF